MEYNVLIDLMITRHKTLANGDIHENLRSPGGVSLTHTQVLVCIVWFGSREDKKDPLPFFWPDF